MGRGAGKGGKNRKKNRNQDMATRRPLQLKEDDQEYALVSKMLGSSRVQCHCAGKTIYNKPIKSNINLHFRWESKDLLNQRKNEE